MAGNLAHLFTSITSFAQQCVGILRFKEFDTTTPEGRSQERYRRAALAALSSGAARVLTIITMLISVPLTLHYLGSERYGLWMTITSFFLMMRFADLGMGLGLMNAVAEAHGREDRQEAVRYVSSGFFMLLAVASCLLVGFTFAYPFIPWSRVFNLQSQLAIREAGPAMAVFMACFLASLPLGVVQRVQDGFQEAYVNRIYESAGKVLGLVGLLLVIYLKAGLVWLVLAVFGAPAVAWLLNSLVLFGYQRPCLRPRFKSYQSASARRLFHTGLFFFAIQIGVTFIYASDNLIITQFLGPEAVTQYAIPYQLFSIGYVIFVIFISPLWPAYSEAIARGDMSWVQKTLKRSLKLILLFTVLVSIFLVIFGNQLLKLWVGPQISPSLLLTLGLGLWMIVFPLGTAMSHLLNAANIFRFQVIFISLTVIFSLVFKCIFVYYFDLAGIIWGTALVYIILIIVPYGYFIHKMFYKEVMIPSPKVN